METLGVHLSHNGANTATYKLSFKSSAIYDRTVHPCITDTGVYCPSNVTENNPNIGLLEASGRLELRPEEGLYLMECSQLEIYYDDSSWQ